MPSAIRYRCETLVDPRHPTRRQGGITMQTAPQAASLWGGEMLLDDGQCFAVTPDRWDGRPTYWEWRRDSATRLSLSEARRRFPSLNI